MLTGICPCPAAAALPDVPNVICAETFGQIQKVAFQRLRKDDGTKNSFTTALPITAKASWTPKLTAEDSTKIVVSPYIQAPTNEPGAARTFGGGNETLGGVEEIIGHGKNETNGSQSGNGAYVHCQSALRQHDHELIQHTSSRGKTDREADGDEKRLNVKDAIR